MPETVAEVAAVVTVDNDELERGMKEAEDVLRGSAESVRNAERQKQGEFDRTSFAVGRMSRTYLAAAGVSGGIGGFLLTSKLLRTELGLLKDSVGFLADEIVIGLGADEGVAGITEGVYEAADAVADLNKEGKAFEERAGDSWWSRVVKANTPDFVSGLLARAAQAGEDISGWAAAQVTSALENPGARERALGARSGLSPGEIAFVEQALRLEQAAGTGVSFLLTSGQAPAGSDLQYLLTRYFEMQLRATGSIS